MTWPVLNCLAPIYETIHPPLKTRFFHAQVETFLFEAFWKKRLVTLRGIRTPELSQKNKIFYMNSKNSGSPIFFICDDKRTTAAIKNQGVGERLHNKK